MSLDHSDPRLRQRAERLARTKVTRDSTGCWIWQGAKTKEGYGTIGIIVDGRRTNTSVHRLFYAAYVDDIPRGESVHHRCGTRACVNPEHLEPISQRENMAEMFERRALRASIEHAEETMAAMADAIRDAYSQDHEG